MGALVLALHWGLLGGALHWVPGPEAGSEAATPPQSLSTRLVTATPPPADATVQPAAAAPAQPPVPPRPRPAEAAPQHTDIAAALAPDTPVAPPPGDTHAPPANAPAQDTASAQSGTEATPPPVIETAPPKPAEWPLQFAFPPSMQLNYDVTGLTDGQKNVVSASIVWRHDGAAYQASLQVTKFMVSLRQWNSKGALTVAGLAPARFGEKGFRRAEVASHFVREEGRVIFSANSAPATLLPGAQDHMSVFIQLASMWAGEPQRFGAGDTLSFQSIGPRQAETWTFVVSAEERISLPGGTVQAVKLTREPNGEYSTKAEIWLAPQLAYMPAHIRLSEPNGNVLDMVWTDTLPL